MSVRDEVLAQPEADRLDYALGLLDLAYGYSDDGQVAWARETFGLDPSQARIFLALNGAAPRMLTRDHLMEVACRGIHGVASNTLSVHVSRLRGALRARGGPDITLVWGQGYRIVSRMDVGSVPTDAVGRQGDVWSRQEDEDLLLMADTGSSTEAMAYELDRSEGSIRRRLSHLATIKGVAAGPSRQGRAAWPEPPCRSAGRT